MSLLQNSGFARFATHRILQVQQNTETLIIPTTVFVPGGEFCKSLIYL
jgi:hypothetical protein